MGKLKVIGIMLVSILVFSGCSNSAEIEKLEGQRARKEAELKARAEIEKANAEAAAAEKIDETNEEEVETDNETEIWDQTATVIQEPSEDEIYNFMVSKYNEITNYGANYIPEIHDPEVSRLASEKFGISQSKADEIFIRKEMSKY
ncbi:hypothetical protein [Cytobacillus praedii]|uniref:hypothetical protein n=1 Tax=Cytobacillus praedii TaxID=1742358 RepID=UPI002E2042DB|nr:hypothetical protein [Cytobacillus praedii]MED3575067.1 hypothetical protein [Cytobacillus praedii]